MDLNRLRIAPFSYTAGEREDDFDAIVQALLECGAVVFASPVYWYAMSGPMKIVFDRLTDLLITPDGRRRARALAGRNVWLLATGTDSSLPASFTEPFRLTAAYLGMNYQGAYYVRCWKDSPPSEAELQGVDALAVRLAPA